MPHGQSSDDYADDHVTLSVEGPTTSRPTLRLRAAGQGIGAVVDLTTLGAQRLSGGAECGGSMAAG